MTMSGDSEGAKTTNDSFTQGENKFERKGKTFVTKCLFHELKIYFSELVIKKFVMGK